MKDLSLNGRRFSGQQLLTFSPGNYSGLSDYEKRLLHFCYQWLNGQETFTLRTSGSTGSPKPITLSREQMALSARLTGQTLGLAMGDHALVCLSADYIAGRMMLVRGFELGLRLTIIDPASNPLLGFDEDASFDFTALVPLQLQEILTNTPQKAPILNRMKAILIGGAPVSVALQARLQTVTAPIYHTYGMTETVTHIALRRLNGPQAGDYFVPFEDVKLGLDDRGCLTITAALTRGATLHTNDLVDLQPDGRFRWLGRIDNVINSGGVKVQVEKVERALEEFLYHYGGGSYADRRFFVGPLDHPRFGQAVVAIIEGGPLENNGADLRAALRETLPQSLSKYEVPQEIYFVRTFAETPTGKIDRRAALRQLAGQ
jgi:O-succinylbenzoic acid--CoA ligase